MTDNRTNWNISIPTWLADEINERYRDPFTGAPFYGLRSRLITKLLIDHMNKVRNNPLTAATDLEQELDPEPLPPNVPSDWKGLI